MSEWKNVRMNGRMNGKINEEWTNGGDK